MRAANAVAVAHRWRVMMTPTRTLVLAEPGCTHEGRLDALMQLLHVAKQADADCYKPQWTSNPQRMCDRRHIGPDHPKREYYLRAYSWLAFPVEWHAELSAKAHELGMQYYATVFLPEDAWPLEPYVDGYKIASFEADEPKLRGAIASTGKPYIFSTGMGAEASGFYWGGGPRWLHCVSAYPAPIDDMNIGILRKPECAGLSDHSRDLDMGMMAVCAGASIVETHFRLYDCNPENPDYPVAFDPGELAMYVAKVRKAERALGSGVKQVQPSEEWALPYKVMA